MAKEHTVIGLTKPTLAAVIALIAVLAALAFWNDRGSSTATAAAAINQGIQSNTTRHDNQDLRVGAVEKRVKTVEDDQHKAELARVGMARDIKSTSEDTAEIKDDMKELKTYLMQYDYKKKEN